MSIYVGGKMDREIMEIDQKKYYELQTDQHPSMAFFFFFTFMNTEAMVLLFAS